MSKINIKFYNKKLFFIFALAAVLLLVFIFHNSAQNGADSSAASDKVTKIAGDILDSVGIEHEPEKLSHFIRKDAHFTEFFLLSLTLFYAIYFFKGNKRVSAILPPILCAIVASIDEFIVQRATEGRSPQILDVLIDFSGALFAVLILYFALSRYLKKKAK